MILEGSVRNTGIHAAGIIIAPKDLTEIIPVYTSKETDLLITQYEGSIIEDAGVIKMDFLGLKTLTIIRDALRPDRAKPRRQNRYRRPSRSTTVKPTNSTSRRNQRHLPV
jgi:DNA polymerase III alpha subunit